MLPFIVVCISIYKVNKIKAYLMFDKVNERVMSAVTKENGGLYWKLWRGEKFR